MRSLSTARDRGRVAGRDQVESLEAMGLAKLMLDGRTTEVHNTLVAAAYNAGSRELLAGGSAEEGSAHVEGFLEGANAAFSALLAKILNSPAASQ